MINHVYISAEVNSEVRAMLGPEQINRWPMAMRRLEINFEDQCRRSGYTGDNITADDPRRCVDMVGTIAMAAAEEGGELHALADALLTPDRVLEFERHDWHLIDLAEIVLAFETSYRSALETHRDEVREHLLEYTTRLNRGDRVAASRLERRKIDAVRRLWDLRLRFVDDVAHVAREAVSEESARAWLRRCDQRFCPVLYLGESTDMLYERILSLEDLETAVLEAIQDLYSRHCAWRDEVKARIVRLEIEERCSQLWSTYDDKGGTFARLEKAHQQRVDRARQVNQAMLSLLPPQHGPALRAAWDEWRRKWDINPNLNPTTVYVRP